MPRRMRVCSEPGCPALSDKPKCLAHRREAEKLRGTRQQRGYGAEHDAKRRDYVALFDKGPVTCWRCGKTIASPADMDTGHNDLDRTQYRGPEHAACNRATAGRQYPSPPP